MEKETYTLTFGDRAENHVGMQILGDFAPDGYNLEDLQSIKSIFEERGATPVIYDLVGLLSEKDRERAEPAYLLYIPDGIQYIVDKDKLYEEQIKLEKDTKAFMYGRVVNKHARYNLCFSYESQEPDYEKGKGRVVAFDTVPILTEMREKMPSFFGEKSKDLLVEGNYYYDITKCGIGFHGDSERRRVIGARLGASFPLHYHWFEKSLPVGDRGGLTLNHGDMYVMSEKAVGTDWKTKNKLTLRHAAGASKFLEIKKK